MQNKFSKILFGIGLIFILFCIVFFAIFPLFHFGFFPIHDDEQIARLYEMVKVLSQGQIPPRWVPDLGFGFGFPLYNFYPPLVYYLGSIFHFFGAGYIDSTKIVIGLGFLLSALGMFLWTRRNFGNIAGLFASILYTYAPYHSVDIYVRGALSEFFSFVLIPFVLWSTDLLFEGNGKKYIFLNGLLFGLLILSHTLVVVQFVPILIGYILIRIFLTKRKIKKIIEITLSFLISLGITSYFWIPSILEKQYTLVDKILTTELANYKLHFVCLQQLWSSPWGYGGSVPGCVDGLSFQVGKIQLIIAFIGILLSIYLLLKKKNLIPILGVWIFAFSIFMTLPYSQFVWDHVSALWYIQFPWRYLLFVAVGSSFLGAFVIYFLQEKFGRSVAIGVTIVLAILSVYQVRNYFKPQSYFNLTDSYYTSLRDINFRVSSMSYEYVPNEVATRLSSLNTTELAVDKTDIPTLSYKIVRGHGTVGEVENRSQLKRYSVRVYNNNGFTFQINTFNFPGWEIFVNGKRVSNLLKNKLDLIQFDLQKGNNNVIVKFVETPIRQIGDSITIATLIGICFYCLFLIRKKYE